MRYSLWSHGRLLGHTTLDFYPSFPGSRMGWLDLTELGERFADAPLESLEFQLRDPTGAVVVTRHIAVQDTDRMIAMAGEFEDDLEPDIEDERFDDEFEAAL